MAKNCALYVSKNCAVLLAEKCVLYLTIYNSAGIRQNIKNLWNKVPTFKKYMYDVATIHVPMKQSVIRSALNDEDVMISTMKPGTYYYKVQ